MIKVIKNILFGPTFRLKARREAKEITKLVKPYKNILDFGCGNMYVTKFVSDGLPKSKITGVDVIDDNLTNLKPILYTGKKLPFKNNEFDIAYSVFVLHHIPDQQKLLKELSRVAKKLIIIEEIYSNIFEKYLTFLNDYTNRFESLTMDIPLKFHTDSEWKQVFKKMGLKLILERRFYQYPFMNLTKQKLYYLERQ